MVGFFLILVLFDKYSVIPKYFFSKKCVFDTGPLIKAKADFSFNNFKAILKQLLIYLFETLEILSKTFLNLYSTLTIFMYFLFKFEF